MKRIWMAQLERLLTVRYSEEYYGLRDVPDIRWEMDARGELHNYVVGEITGALVEYRMELGDTFHRLEVTAKADRPGPVRLRVYVDARPIGEVAIDRADDANQTTVLDLGTWSRGPHNVAIEFVNDTWDGSGREEGDRNLYLDALRVTQGPS